jgi:MFS superfamily sulfate permease-like transporter
MKQQPDREINIGFVLLGVMGIVFGILRLGSHIEYLPSDIRSEPWFNPAASAVMAAVGTFFLIAGLVRAVRGRRGSK